MDSLPWTVIGLVEAIAAGRVSPLEAFDEAARRLEARNPVLNAVITTDLDRARARVLAGLPAGPLHGLPYLVKDLHAEVAGLPMSRGSRLWAQLAPAPSRSSAVVQRLEGAGAVIMGRTNSPELGLNITTEPALWGATRNPWDHSRSSGGSSGGSAAAVAAGVVPAAHASDSGGSIRIPAAWCGVLGFKPTRGTIPLGPVRRRSWEGLSHEHAITTTVADSVRLLQATAGPWPGDAHQRPVPHLGDLSAPAQLRVGLCTDHPGGATVSPAALRAVTDAAAVLQQHGHLVQPLPTPTAFARCGPAMAPIIAANLRCDLDGLPGTVDTDLLEPAVRDLVAMADTMSAAAYLAAVEHLRTVAGQITDALAVVDLVMTPTTASTAPRLGELHTDRPAGELFAEIFTRSPFVAAFNVTGGPALSLPWALDEGGVPVGVQIAGAPGRDRDVLALAGQLAAAQPWRAVWDPRTERVVTASG